MKRSIAIFATLSVLISSFGGTFAHAADTVDTDHLEVTASQTAKVGESIDITVKAVAKDGSTVKNYAGTIFFTVDKDSKATVPYAEGYTFLTADQGQKTFSKALSFTKEGTLKVTVSDFDKPKLEGSATVKVSAGGTAPSAGTELVTITSPDNNTTLGNPNFSVVGSTKKNSKVQLFVNGTKALESQTDERGGFVFEVKKTDQTKNVLSVKVLDGSDKVIGESAKVTVTVGSDGPEFTSLKLSQSTVAASSTVTVTVQATPALKAVTVSVESAIVALKESLPGTYSADFTAPAIANIYPVDVSLTNELGKETLKTSAGTLTVTGAPAANYKNIKVEKTDKKATFTFDMENEPVTLQKFAFVYSTGAITSTGSLTGLAKSVTFEKSKIKNASGSYVWYVNNLDIAKYNFVIVGLGFEDQPMPEATSDVIPVDLTLGAAGMCVINNVGGLKVSLKQDSSVLTWDAIPEAASYNVYKKNSVGEYVMIENVPSNTYTVHIAAGPVKFEDFTVKAVCADKTESAKFAPTTRVQTGPAELFLLIALALAAGFVFLRRRRSQGA